MCCHWISCVKCLKGRSAKSIKDEKCWKKWAGRKAKGWVKREREWKTRWDGLFVPTISEVKQLCPDILCHSLCRLNWKSGRPSQAWGPAPPCLWTACLPTNQSPGRTGRKRVKDTQMLSSPMLQHLKLRTTRHPKPGSEPRTQSPWLKWTQKAEVRSGLCSYCECTKLKV